MKEYLALFTAEFGHYNEDNKFITETEHGIIPADNFKDAMDQIEIYYGQELISIKIELFDATVFTFADEHYKLIRTLLEV